MSGSSGYRRIGTRSLIVAAVSATVLSVAVAAAAAASNVGPASAQSPGHSPVPVFSAANGVSCSSTSSCVAVGVYNTDGNIGVLTEMWDGRAWSVIPSPSPAGVLSSTLDAVSCASAAHCVAVGTYTDGNYLSWPFAESWDGSSWTLLDVPTPTGGSNAELTGVSCPSVSSCVAVGQFHNSRSRQVPLTEFWNGAAWSVHDSPHPTGARSSGLTAVSCATMSSCMATGAYNNTDYVGLPLAERWNGSAWTVVAAPAPANAQGSYFDSVSCPTATSCTAVGGYYDDTFTGETLVESWNGSQWSVTASPTPDGSPDTALYSVSCVSTAHCLAVGHSYSASFAGKDDNLAEAWDGTSWQIVPSPSPSTNSALYGVSCVSASRCLAAGLFYNSSNNYQTLAESWNGVSLSIVNQDADLAGVSCVDATRCVAVGSAISGSISVTRAVVWNGKHWSSSRTPNPGDSEGSYLQAVDCISANDCVAVGYYYRLDNTRLTLVEQWDGHRWTIVPSPNVDGAAYSVLYGVSCSSASSCMAVGSAASYVLAESWDGSQWTIVPTANHFTTAYSELAGVSCSSASSCLAVGYDTDTYYHADITLAEKWNGAKWKIVPSASPGKLRVRSAVLHDLSCSAADTCMSVGYRQTRSGDFVTMTEHWTGTGWAVQPSPSPTGSAYSDLNAISCVGSGDCLAVGDYLDPSGNYLPLGETWTNGAWQITAGPTLAPSGIAYLDDVSCGAVGTCVAVGTSGDPANMDPLTQLWNG